MGLALSRIPGIPDNQLPAPTAVAAQKHWSHIDTASSEHALLLCCPTASRDIADEAAWRLLAQVCQTPFYQRLRVELQLGYAVFSALRQTHGQTAMLFGVQSPNTQPAELLGHIRQFFESLPKLIEKMDESSFEQQRQSLADQFDDANLSSKVAAELLWQAKLAGHSSDYLEQLPTAILQLNRQSLLAAAQRLINADGGWLCLASAPAPETPWQAAN
jgi:secreted Zn-dependent insulinase-like peptidase